MGEQHDRGAEVSKGGDDLPQTGPVIGVVGTVNGGDEVRPRGIDTFGQCGRGVSDSFASAEADIGHDVANVDGAVGQALVGEVAHSDLGRGEQQVGGVVGQDTVVFLRHAPVERAKSRLEMCDRQMHLHGGECGRDGGVGVAVDEGPVRLVLAPTEVAMGHLVHEGLADRAFNVGDVMADVCYRIRDAVSDSPAELPEGVNPTRPYLVATIHRADNTDDEARLREIVAALRDLSTPVVLLAHPRLVARASAFGIDLAGGALHTTTPLAYPQMVRAVIGSAGVVTDSGGVQKEAFLLGVPCTTLRTETEWVETLEDGWNILDPDLTHLREVAVRPRPTSPQARPYGDGHAVSRVVSALRKGDPALRYRAPSSDRCGPTR